MNPLPVNAKSLRRRAVQFTDVQAPRITLLPCFDESGAVQSLLVVDHGTARVSRLEWRGSLVRVPWSGPVRVDAAFGSLRPLGSIEASQAAELWHYDPDWLLGRASSAAGADYARIVAMNCDGRWREKVAGVFFRRNLSRISLVGIRRNGGYSLVPWRAKYLPAAPAAPPKVAQPLCGVLPRVSRRTGWVLDPIWQR